MAHPASFITMDEAWDDWDAMLTNGTSIMPCKFALTRPELITVHSVSLTGSILSLVGASFMLVCYFLFYGSLYPAPISKTKRSIIKMITWLSLAEYLWCIQTLVERSILLFNPTVYSSDSGHMACKALRIIFQWSALASLVWTNCISFYILMIATRRWTEYKMPSKWVYGLFHGLSWGIPTIVCILTLVLPANVHPRFSGGTCMPIKEYHISLWITPISASVLVSLTFYGVVMFYVWRGAHFDLLGNRAIGIRIAFFSLTCICWIPDIVVYSIDSVTGCMIFATVVLYNLTRNLQGAFDALAFGSITYRELKKLYDLRYRNFGHKMAVILSFASAAPFLVIPLFARHAFLRFKAYFDQADSAPPASIQRPSDPLLASYEDSKTYQSV